MARVLRATANLKEAISKDSVLTRRNPLYNHQMQLYQVNRFDSREIELTIRYNFNTAKCKYKGINAGDDEIKRFYTDHYQLPISSLKFYV
jgi:hypothetical protein